MTILDEAEIRSLLARERFARDTGQFEKLRNSFHPDSSKTRVHIMWYDGEIDGFVSASEKLHSPLHQIMHQIIPVEIDVRGIKALAKSWCIIDTRFEHEGGELDAKTYVLLFNQCEKVDGAWKLTTLEIIYQRDMITPVYPTKEPDFGDLSRYRKSYKFTAWMLSNRGLTVSNDLAGGDDPKSCEELLSRNKAWIEAQ